jgi:hypothetical protein
VSRSTPNGSAGGSEGNAKSSYAIHPATASIAAREVETWCDRSITGVTEVSTGMSQYRLMRSSMVGDRKETEREARLT